MDDATTGDDTRIVLFDLDDTICRYPRSTADLLDVAFDRTGVDPFFSAETFEAWISRVEGESVLDLREKCFRGIADERGRSTELAEQLAANYPERDPTAVELLPGAESAIEFLADRYRLGIVSNGAAETQRAKLDTLDLDRYFDVTVFATPSTAIKPDPGPFDRALDRFGVGPDRAVHVGNSLASDVAGAHAAGVQSVWLRQETPAGADVAPDYVIEDLAALHADPLPWAEE